MKISVQRWVRAIFGLKINPAIFRPFLFPPKEQGIDFNLDSSFKLEQTNITLSYCAKIVAMSASFLVA